MVNRYSKAFKQKVVNEIEEGKLTISGAQKLYNITGGETIQKWIKKMGKNYLLNKVVRIELADELRELTKVQKEKKELESALAQAHLKIVSLEKMLEIAGREYGEDFKKKVRYRSIKEIIETNSSYTIKEVCINFEISRQSYYQYQKRVVTEIYEEEIIIQLICEKRKRLVKIGGRKLYKSLQPKLKELGFRVGRDRLFEIMRKNDLLIENKKKYVVTTNSSHRFRIYGNLIKGVEVSTPGEIMVGDITYIETYEGYMYLALLTDIYCRKIMGYDISESLSAEGSIRALKMALKNRINWKSCIHHSDRGIQYCCNDYIRILKENEIKISMAEKGNPYENAIAERVNGILKTEFLLDQRFRKKREARAFTIEAIKIYNDERPHMSLGYLTPEEKYQEYQQKVVKGKFLRAGANSSRATPSFR